MKKSAFVLFPSLLMGMLALQAHDIKLSYKLEAISNEQHQLELFAQANGKDELKLKAINFSFLFDLTCIHPTSYNHLFSNTWTAYLENIQQTPSIEVVGYSAALATRWQFGSADPGLPSTSSVILPSADQEALPIMTISLEGTCAHSLRLESQFENSLNQFADEQMNLLSYKLVEDGHEGPTAADFSFVSTSVRAHSSNQSEISWKAINESDGARFEIEKSDSPDFLDFFVIFRKKAANLGQESNSYHFLEFGEMPSMAYYRLKYIDLEGRVGYSSVMQLSRHLSYQIQANAFPNPTTDYVELTLSGQPNETLSLALRDLNGKKLEKHSISLDRAGHAQLLLDVRAYPVAVYVLDVAQANHSQPIRIVKK